MFYYVKPSSIFLKPSFILRLRLKPGLESSVIQPIKSGSKKSLWCDLEEKCLRNSKIFFDGVFLFSFLHLLKKSGLFKLCIKKVMGL